MKPISHWDMCCEKAVQHMLLCGVKTGCARTVRNWYLDFGKKKRKFDMSLPRKHKLPMFLDFNAEEKQKKQQFSKEHLHELSVELVSEYIHDVIIPAMVQERYLVTPVEKRYKETAKGLIPEFGLKIYAQVQYISGSSSLALNMNHEGRAIMWMVMKSQKQ